MNERKARFCKVEEGFSLTELCGITYGGGKRQKNLAVNDKWSVYKFTASLFTFQLMWLKREWRNISITHILRLAICSLYQIYRKLTKFSQWHYRSHSFWILIWSLQCNKGNVKSPKQTFSLRRFKNKRLA